MNLNTLLGRHEDHGMQRVARVLGRLYRRIKFLGHGPATKRGYAVHWATVPADRRDEAVAIVGGEAHVSEPTDGVVRVSVVAE